MLGEKFILDFLSIAVWKIAARYSELKISRERLSFQKELGETRDAVIPRHVTMLFPDFPFPCHSRAPTRESPFRDYRIKSDNDS